MYLELFKALGLLILACILVLFLAVIIHFLWNYFLDGYLGEGKYWHFR